MLLLAGVAVCVLSSGGVPARAQEAQEPVEACVIKIEGVINSARAKAVMRQIERARRLGAGTVILELNTPGGTLDASRALGDFVFTRDDLRIVAYVNNDAFSGGTMVALACQAIYMDARLGSIGDVAPVGPTGEILGEKQQTVVRDSMLKYARARGYPLALVRSMVTKEIEVLRLQMEDEPEGAYRYVEGTELDLWDEERLAKIVDQRIVVNAGELLTVGSEQAIEFGFARAAVSGAEELYELLELDPARVIELHLTASERLLALLDTFSPLLLVAGMILLYMELSQPGVGLPGLLALICFGVFFIVKWTQAYVHMLEIVLFGIGMVLLLLEVFVIPGFGVAGIAGIACVFVSLVLAFQGFTVPTTAEQVRTLEVSIVTVLGAFALSGLLMAVLARFLPSVPLFRRITHVDTLAAAHVGDIGEVHTPGLAGMTGEVGVALTPLHPAGRAEFGERLLDVVTEGEFVPKGARVRILAVQGPRVVVERCEGA